MRKWLVGLAGVAAGAASMAYAAKSNEERLQRELDGWVVAGPAERCIDLRRITATAAYGDTILFKIRSSTKYRTQSPGCPAARVGLTVIAESRHGRICAGDQVMLGDLDNDITEGSCSVGAFTPYKRQ